MARASDVTKTVVESVASHENVAPNDLPPLEDTIETETFHQLLSPDDERTGRLTFEYLWYDVTVLPDGEVVVTP